jgi:hypothetical protein
MALRHAGPGAFGIRRLALFEYADKKAAEKKAAELTASSRANHFVNLVKEPIAE